MGGWALVGECHVSAGLPLLAQRRRDDNKNRICAFEGGWGIRGGEGNRPKTLFFFVGNATTIKF